MRGRAEVRIELAGAERAEVEARARRRKSLRADALRAEIVLLAASGMTNLGIAKRHGVTRVTVTAWRNRFAAKRLGGLFDEPRPGAPRKIGDDKIAEVVTTTLETMPAAATHWSTRSMARASGLSVSTVHRIWRAFSLQPHRSETFKRSSDPLFVEKVRDIVGLYLGPPDRALVLCVDEKSQIQVPDRTQPLLPMRPGQAKRRTYDDKRHGATSLFAALDVKAGTIIGPCMSRHRAAEFRRFLDAVERTRPRDLDIPVIMNNASSRNTKLIRDWFAKRPNWHLHFTPTASSWINQSLPSGLTRGSSASPHCGPSSRSIAAPIAPRASWTQPLVPTSTSATRTPSPSAGPRPPTTSSHRSPASAAAPSPSKPNVHRNFKIGTLMSPSPASKGCPCHGGSRPRPEITRIRSPGRTGRSKIITRAQLCQDLLQDGGINYTADAHVQLANPDLDAAARCQLLHDLRRNRRRRCCRRIRFRRRGPFRRCRLLRNPERNKRPTGHRRRPHLTSPSPQQTPVHAVPERNLRHPRPRLKTLGQDFGLLLHRPAPPARHPGDQLDPPIRATLIAVIKTCICHGDSSAPSSRRAELRPFSRVTTNGELAALT